MMLLNSYVLLCLALYASQTIATIAFPEQKEAIWTTKNFTFHSGEIIQNFKIGYITLGNRANPAVLILHGTAQNSKSLFTPDFTDQLFGQNQVLDASKYYIIIPDAIGVGKSTKPSDGLRAKFPNYNYDDMVLGQYRLVTEGLGIKHLHLVLGNSMGGSQAWLWGIYYKDMMDYLIPMASAPAAMAGRNWIMRRILTQTIRNDPTWQNGNYTVQPQSIKVANTMFSFATSGGSQHLQKIAPNTTNAEIAIQQRLNTPIIDANNFLYQWESSRDYNPVGVDQIKAKVLAINAEDDERYPPELGLIEPILKQIKNSKLYLIPRSPETNGHGTTVQAKWWKEEATKFLNGEYDTKPPSFRPTKPPTRHGKHDDRDDKSDEDHDMVTVERHVFLRGSTSN